MPSILMDKIDRALMTMELHELARLYDGAYRGERSSSEPMPRLFYGILRRHISSAVSRKLESKGEDMASDGSTR